ncbi:FAD-dependent oxidoreductase [Amycolatopsis sp. NPDC059090]|uniref:FAD-dependent oxidoreductase n=1 Tax=unclassified Amycolatopsis TaxID=2618356 RepID=UPI00366BEE2D
MTAAPDALVLGSGIIGLTTALALQEAGSRVRIRTAAPPEETTSTKAAAMVGPNLDPPGSPGHRWQQETLRRLRAAPPGVRVLDGRLVARPAGAIPPGADQTEGFRLCEPAELPEGYGTGFWVTLPIVDTPKYLQHLRSEFEAGGGTLEVRPAASLAEASEECPAVVNCTGLAARELAADERVEPVRGIKVVVADPGLESFFLEAPINPEWATYLPHGDHVVLGGVQTGGADPEPSDAEVAAILERCVRVEPRLAGAELLEASVGFRPGRDEVRLEADRDGGSVVVHNYGHGGSGVMYSWGCAADVVALLSS